ncbi:MAG: ribonuclease P protein component [Roseateles sp.]
MLGRIVRSADFERVLGRPACARSALFAVHHLAAGPSPSAWALSTDRAKLSTGPAQAAHRLVDEAADPARAAAPATPPAPVPTPEPKGAWVGVVVPKRFARRAVTRSLVKRQMRVAMSDRQAALPPGLWVLRLRSPIDRKAFPSAASDALRAVVRAELGGLLDRAVQRLNAQAGVVA